MDTENVVNEENTEVVEETVEGNGEVVSEESTEVEAQETPEIEPVKTFTQDEVNAMIKARVDRQTRRFNKEMDQYKKLETYSKKLYETDSLDDTFAKIEETYKEFGKEAPQFESFQADRDTQVLAKADAREVISQGEAETAEEYRRLREVPESRKTKRDKIMEDILYENLKGIEQERAFVKQGGDRKVLEDSEFQNFKSKFANDTDLYEIYKMYQALNGEQEEEIKPVGSLKSQGTDGFKDFITKEEFRKLTAADYERYEKQGLDLVAIVEESMKEWD